LAFAKSLDVAEALVLLTENQGNITVFDSVN